VTAKLLREFFCGGVGGDSGTGLFPGRCEGGACDESNPYLLCGSMDCFASLCKRRRSDPGLPPLP